MQNQQNYSQVMTSPMLLKSTMTNGIIERTLTNQSDLSATLWDRNPSINAKTPRENATIPAKISIVANKNLTAMRKRMDQRNLPLAAHVDRNFSHSKSLIQTTGKEQENTVLSSSKTVPGAAAAATTNE